MSVADDLAGERWFGEITDRASGCGSGSVCAHDQRGVEVPDGRGAGVLTADAHRIEPVPQDPQ